MITPVKKIKVGKVIKSARAGLAQDGSVGKSICHARIMTGLSAVPGNHGGRRNPPPQVNL